MLRRIMRKVAHHVDAEVSKLAGSEIREPAGGGATHDEFRMKEGRYKKKAEIYKLQRQVGAAKKMLTKVLKDVESCEIFENMFVLWEAMVTTFLQRVWP